MSRVTERRRCQMAGAASRLAEKPRTIRNLAAAGKIPGAAKISGTWSFDIDLLDALVSERMKACQVASARRQRVATGGTAFSMAGFSVPAAKTSDGHYAQTIQRLRNVAARRNTPA